MDLMGQWVEECRTQHTFCMEDHNPVLPKRVLRFHRTPTNVNISLWEPRGSRARYIALSHCWGRNWTFMTNTTNIKERRIKIVWSELPKTFQDAICVAERLGIEYLWIDSLCIVQDNRLDWEEESSKMGRIYENAFVTVAAACAADDIAGFLGPRMHPVFPELQLTANHLNDSVHTVKIRCRLHAPGHENEHYAVWLPRPDPLDARAWCFQEMALATRLLTFSNYELRWQCKTLAKCECGSWQTSGHHLTSDFAPWRHTNGDAEYIHKAWRDTIVNNYSSRRLTYESDRLPVLSGIASRIRQATQDEYIAGIWKSDLPLSLLWEGQGLSVTEAYISLEYRAPSFSWASIDRRVTYKLTLTENSNYKISGTFKSLVDIVSATCEPVGVDPTGEVCDGVLSIRGHLFEAWIRHSLTPSAPPGGFSIVLQHNNDNIELDDLTEYNKPNGHWFLPDVPLTYLKCGDGSYQAQRVTARGKHHQGALPLRCQGFYLPVGTYDDYAIGLVLGYSQRRPGCLERLGLARVNLSAMMETFDSTPVQGVIVV